MAKELHIIIPIAFGLIGFFFAFFMKRALNIAIFTIFVYASFLLLDRLDLAQDWKVFQEITGALQTVGTKVIEMIKNLLGNASTMAIFLFIIGGAAGLFTKRGV
jgi:hypothetical protein